jgi:hypothetical protein
VSATVLRAASVVSVAAPLGSGRAAAVTGNPAESMSVATPSAPIASLTIW